MRYFSRRGSLAGFLRTLPGLPWDRANPMVFTRDAFQTCYRSSLRSSSRRILIVPFSILVDGKPSFLPSSPPPVQRNGSRVHATSQIRTIFPSTVSTIETAEYVLLIYLFLRLQMVVTCGNTQETRCSFLPRESSSSFEIHDAPC